MTATDPKSSEAGTPPAGKAKDRWPLRFRLLMSAAFACFAAIGAGVAMSDGDVWMRIKFGGIGLANALAVIGIWAPLGRGSVHVTEFLRGFFI